MNAPTTLKTISVLMVEDSPMDGRLLMEAMRAAVTAGEVVIQAVKTLNAAKGELQKYSFSCVLLDLGLPDGRGVSNVSALREVDKNAAIVVLTGLDDERSATEALKLGAQDYLVKGETDGEKLMKLIRHAVQRNRQTVEMETRRDSTFFDASRDALTLLPNRSLFLDRARVQLAGARAASSNFGLIYLIVDGVAAAKTQYGANLADELLQKLGQVMGEVLRLSDTLARVEYNQFAVLLQPLDDTESLAVVAKQLQERIKALRIVGNCTVELSAQSGIAFRSGDETVEELFAEARAAAERPPPFVPEAGNEVEIPAVETVPAVNVAGLRLVPHWQPWADVISARWLGLEFLPTWPDGKPLLNPAMSMTEAVEISLSVADALGSQSRLWRGAAHEMGPLGLNVPAAALRDGEFAQRLMQVLQGHNLAPEQVQLEIEESAFKDNSAYAHTLSVLHANGYLLCMDGDGSADISLREFVSTPVTSYKLSRRFLQLLMEEGLHGPSRRFLVATMGAAQALGATIIATGVDTPEAVSALQLIGIPLMQGEALTAMLEPDQVPGVWDSPVRMF